MVGLGLHFVFACFSSLRIGVSFSGEHKVRPYLPIVDGEFGMISYIDFILEFF